MSAQIDNFHAVVTAYYRQLILAIAYLDIGNRTVGSAPPNASVELTLAHDVVTEPIYLRELIPHTADVAQ